MAWFFVDVKLEILIVVEEAATSLEDGEMRVITLRKHVDVVSVCELRLHLHHLSVYAWLAYRVDVRPVACQTSIYSHRAASVRVISNREMS